MSSQWLQLKCKFSPGPRHSHAACRLPGYMLLFGGECNGQPSNDIWRFHFGELQFFDGSCRDAFQSSVQFSATIWYFSYVSASSEFLALLSCLTTENYEPNNMTSFRRVLKLLLQSAFILMKITFGADHFMYGLT